MKAAVRAIVALAFAFLVAASAVRAQTFPTRPVHLLVGGGSGSFPDQVARRLGEQLSSIWGQRVIVVNRPGKHVAMLELINASPDGHTLALATMSQLVFHGFLMNDMPYDPDRDLAPVGTVLSGSMMLVAHPTFPAASLAELVAAARRQPGELNFAVPGNGSPPHLVLAMLMGATGTSFYVVPFKTGSEAVVQVAGGQVPLFIDSPLVVGPLISAGRLKPLAATGTRRIAMFPDVPTVAEQGYPGFRGEAWSGIVTRAGVPSNIVAQINRDLAEALRAPDFRRAFENSGSQTLTGSPQEFGALIRASKEHWGPVIKGLGLKLE
jgi:tripartite-type tricarboxylate transporter receptor subunit TctC